MFGRIRRWLGFDKKQPPVAEAPPREPPAEVAPSEAEPQDGPHPSAAAPPSQPALMAGVPAVAREIEVVVGIDFGTSCTKIAARFPYEAGQPTYALPVPPERRAESHPYLWRSELWLAPDGAFSLHPVSGGEHLSRLKWDLMQSPELSAAGGPQPSPVEAAAAFLALQIRRARGWAALTRPERGDEKLRWLWHIGFPAASLDNSERRLRYEVCLAAALDLAASAEPLRLAQVREATQRACRAPGQILQEANAALFPEIAAAVADFAQSPRHENGLYAMIDVGAGTFDCCTFNLVRHRNADLVRQGDPTATCPIFAADVALLGVEPWRECNGNSLAAMAFRKRLDQCVRTVIWKTRKCRHHNSPRWAEGLPLFLFGGGKGSKPHRECAESLTPWIRCSLGADTYPYPYPNAAIRIVPLPASTFLDCEATESQLRRLTVAAGLSLPADWIPDVELPTTIPDEPKPGKKPEPDPIGPEQT